MELESPGCSGFEGNSNTFPKVIYFLIFLFLLRCAMRPKHLLTFLLLLLCLLPPALVWHYCFGRPQKYANLPNWTDGCTRPGKRVAMEGKLLMGALGGSRERARAPISPSRVPKWLKMPITVKKLKNMNSIINQGPFFGWFHSQVIDLLSSPFLVLLIKGKSSCALLSSRRLIGWIVFQILFALQLLPSSL